MLLEFHILFPLLFIAFHFGKKNDVPLLIWNCISSFVVTQFMPQTKNTILCFILLKINTDTKTAQLDWDAAKNIRKGFSRELLKKCFMFVCVCFWILLEKASSSLKGRFFSCVDNQLELVSRRNVWRNHNLKIHKKFQLKIKIAMLVIKRTVPNKFF